MTKRLNNCNGGLTRGLNRGLGILGLIWLLAALSDRLWFILDQSVPAWDQADYLTGSVNYWHVLQTPEWFSGAWWTGFWALSPKIPPFVYLATAPWLNLFGLGSDQASLVHLGFSGILLGSVYSLGTKLINQPVGLWAAGLCTVLPGLYVYRLQYLLDYPLTAMVTLSFCCLTYWRFTQVAVQPTKRFQPQVQHVSSVQGSRPAWLWAGAFGTSLGLAILTKQTAIFFLAIPTLWTIGEALRRRAWGRLAQLGFSGAIALVLIGPWVRTNWLLMLTSGKRATVDSALAEGDPALTTWGAWTYYWNRLPEQISWPLLLVPLVGLMLYGIRRNLLNSQSSQIQPLNLQEQGFQEPDPMALTLQLGPIWHPGLTWLAVFGLGGYLLCSLNVNKDPRYSLPLLPGLTIFLAYGLTLWPKGWGKAVRWGTVGLALMITLIHLWPVGGSWGKVLAQTLSPEGNHRAYLKQPWPHAEVIDTILQTDPFLQNTLGVLPSTPEINQHNLNYFGALQNQQVFGRQVGTQLENVPQDALSLSWFVTKTNAQGSVGRIEAAQAAMVQAVEHSPQFKRLQQWPLPDNSVLNLYHRQLPYIEVSPQSQVVTQVKLVEVMTATKSPPGVPLPVTYTWAGPWEQLRSGLVLLTWQQRVINSPGRVGPQWLHDHGIAMGTLRPGSLTESSGVEPTSGSFQVVERMGMLPPPGLPPGQYTLTATYLNRKTGETYSIATPAITIEIDPNAIPLPAPELDLVTQLRQWAQGLPQGMAGLERVFAEVGRVNQYDPVQNYTLQAEQSLTYRLQHSSEALSSEVLRPETLDWAYALALAQVLQQDSQGAIQALQQVTQLDPSNPFAHAYLAFVYLYRWQPRSAETAIQTALKLKPEQSEFQALRGISSLMQGNLIQAWKDLQGLS